MIHYTPEAVLDLNRLRVFIAKHNPQAARIISSEIKQGINQLNNFPLLGIEVSGAPDSKKIRDLFIGDYTVRYLIAGVNVFVLRLWHDKENQRNLA